MVIHGCSDKQDKTFPNSLLIIDKYSSIYLNDLERAGHGVFARDQPILVSVY